MPANWWRSSRIRVLVPLLLLMGVGFGVVFVLVRIGLDQMSGSTHGQISSRQVFDSVEGLSPIITHIAVVRVSDAPTKGTNEDEWIVFDDFPVIVDRYLRGSGADSLVVRMTAEYNFPSDAGDAGSTLRYPADRSLVLEEGNSYVLFLGPGSPGHWIPIGEPGGFKLEGDVLLPTSGPISPEDWGVSTLGDLEREIERLENLPPPTSLSAPDSS